MPKAKDLTGKKCFDESKLIRLAIRDKNDNNILINTLKNAVSVF